MPAVTSADRSLNRSVEGRADPGGQPPKLSRDWRTVARSTRERLSQHDLPSLAAAVAFAIFLSLFPGLAAAVAISTIVSDPITLSDRASELLASFPQAATELIRDQIIVLTTGEGAGSVAFLGVVTGLWAASSAAAMLIKALNRINGVTEARGFLKQRAVALLLVLALFIAIAVLIVLVVLGPQLQDAVLPERLLDGVANVLLGLAQVAGAIVVLVPLFAFVYWLGPNRERPRWQWVSPGALIGVIGWLVLSGLFSIYTQTAGNYDATYSAVAGVAVTLVWLQLSMTVLLLGAEVNAESERLAGRGEALTEGAGQALVEPRAEPVPLGVQAEQQAESPPPRREVVRASQTSATPGRDAFAVAAAAAAAAALAVFTIRRRRR